MRCLNGLLRGRFCSLIPQATHWRHCECSASFRAVVRMQADTYEGRHDYIVRDSNVREVREAVRIEAK